MYTKLRQAMIAVIVFAAMLVYSVGPTYAQGSVAAVVEGEPITKSNVLNRQKLMRAVGEVDSYTAALTELINDLLIGREATRVGVEVTGEELEQQITAVAQRNALSVNDFLIALARQDLNRDDFLNRTKSVMEITRLVELRNEDNTINDTNFVTEAVVIYDLVDITLVISNRDGDEGLKRRSEQTQAIMSNFRNCNDGIPFVQQFEEVIVDRIGSRYSDSLNPQLHEQLSNQDIGTPISPWRDNSGIKIVVACDVKTVLDDSKVRKSLAPNAESGVKIAADEITAELRRGAVIDVR